MSSARTRFRTKTRSPSSAASPRPSRAAPAGGNVPDRKGETYASSFEAPVDRSEAAARAGDAAPQGSGAAAAGAQAGLSRAPAQRSGPSEAHDVRFDRRPREMGLPWASPAEEVEPARVRA